MQSGDPTSADFEGVFLEMLVAENIEDRETGGAGNGITPEGGKELHAICKRSGDFRGCNHGGEGKGVANGFAEDDDVWNDLLRFKSPEVRA